MLLERILFLSQLTLKLTLQRKTDTSFFSQFFEAMDFIIFPPPSPAPLPGRPHLATQGLDNGSGMAYIIFVNCMKLYCLLHIKLNVYLNSNFFVYLAFYFKFSATSCATHCRGPVASASQAVGHRRGGPRRPRMGSFLF